MPSRSEQPFDPLEFGDEPARFDWGERFQHWMLSGRRLVRRHWWILLIGVLIGVSIEAWRELRKEPVYVSEASMIVSGRFALPENVYREEVSYFFGTQIHLMTSDRVRTRARERVAMLNPDLPSDWVSLRAIQQPQTSTFLLRAEGGSPDYTQAFLNAVLEEYKAFRREMRSQTSDNTLLSITEQLYRLEEQIDAQEIAVEAFQKENNLVFLKEQGSTAGSYLAKLKNDQADLRTQLLVIESILSESPGALDFSVGGVIDGLLEMTSEPTDRAFLDQRSKLLALRAERAEFSKYLRPKHPKIMNLDHEIERTENLLAILRRQTLDQISERRDSLRRQIESLDSVILQWERTALDISRLSAEFERLNHRLTRSRSVYQGLLDSIQSINLNQQLEQETVEVLEYASSPRASQIQVRRKMVEGGILGFLGGAALVILLGFLDTRIASSEDIRARFEHPILGILPEEKEGGDGRVPILTLHDDRHLFAEAHRTLRSTLLFLKDSNGSSPRTFVITSSIPEEGKSTIAMNLAVACSFTASRTLLVDADLRRGRLHEQLEFRHSPGLADALSDNRDPLEMVQRTPFEYLDFLPMGTRPKQPGELLLSARFSEMLTTLKQRYDFIVFDSAPILATDDTAGFAGRVDALLFTIRANYTLARQVKSAIERLENRRIPVRGFILNRADLRGADYYYQKYESYYATPSH